MEEKSSPAEFLPVVHVISALNDLGCSFYYEFFDDQMFISGIPSSCGSLLALLWLRSLSFAFYPCDKGIQVIFLG